MLFLSDVSIDGGYVLNVPHNLAEQLWRYINPTYDLSFCPFFRCSNGTYIQYSFISAPLKRIRIKRFVQKDFHMPMVLK